MKRKENMELNRIYNEDCVDNMRSMPDNFIDLTVTSPPYDSLREYNGYTFNFPAISQELFRVTKPGGVVVWVVGDSVKNGNQSGTSFTQALYFKQVGFNLYDTIIYKKISGGLPHKGRYTNCFEYMFILSKGKPKTLNLIEDRYNKSAGRKTGKKTVREKNGELTPRESITIQEYGLRFNIWEYAVGKGVGQSNKEAYKHPATFPEALARDHIISWSNEGDLVYDPMCGSGTTCVVAKRLQRNFIGCDVSQEYCKLAESQLEGEK